MRFVHAVLCAVAAAVLVALTLSAAGLSGRIAVVSLAAGAAVGAASLWTERRRTFAPVRLTVWEWLAAIAFALFSLRSFLWLIFVKGDELRVLSPNNLGDLSLHMTYVQELANGAPFWPENPILTGTKLTYPLGVDLLHSLLVLAGVPLIQGFIWMGLTGAALTGLALWRWGRGFALAGFLANGGLAGFAILHSWHWEDFQGPHAWKSIPLALFVTQRGLLFALPAGLALLSSWRTRYFRGQGTPLAWWGEVLLYAAMPVFHLHTFIALSLLLFWWFCSERGQRLPIFLFVATAALPATVLVLCVTAKFHGPAMLGWHPGWMQDDPDFVQWCQDHLGMTNALVRVPVFWIWNFGLLPALVAVLACTVARPSADRRSRAFVWPALVLFLLCCFVKFAVWEWDNTKLMIWAYLLVLPFLWREVLAPRPLWQRYPAVFLLFFSGFVSLVGGLGGEGFPIASRTELAALASGVRGLPPTARIIAHPNYNHPLLLLGHPLALGYTGHVWSHGYAWEKPLHEVESVLKGEPGWAETARGLGCHYLFWGREEREAYPDSPQPWREQTHLSASGDWGALYDLESPPSPSQSAPPQ